LRGHVPIPPRRPEGIRWLRSDGTPNFSSRVHRHEGDAKLIARRPVYTITKTSTVLAAAEEMARHNVRSLLVVKPNSDQLNGIVTSMDIVNYFGGGELYDIVVRRHNGSLYSALLREHVESIMNPNPIRVTVYDRLDRILETMVLKNIGVVPVVMEDDVVWGIITEHDLVMLLAEKKLGRKVREVMTSNVVFIDPGASIREAAESMIKYGIRRLPLIGDGVVKGMVTAKDIVRFIGSHEVFKLVETGSIDEVLEKPVETVAAAKYATISPDADVGDAATAMREEGVSSLLVVEDGELRGIITERDVLYALATRPREE